MKGSILMFFKKGVVLLAALALVLSLAGCSSQTITQVSLPETIQLEVGDSQALIPEYQGKEGTAQEDLTKVAQELVLTWTSDNQEVATVAEDGTVTALASGEALVTLSALDGELTAQCQVTVKEPIPQISANLVTSGDTVEGKTILESSNLEIPQDVVFEELTWKSSDEKVATVDEAGLVTPVGPGSCIITVSGLLDSGDEWAVECNITVKDTVEAFEEDSSESEAAPVVLNAPAQDSGSKTSEASGSSSSGSGKTTASAGSSGTSSSNGTASNPAPAPTPAPQPAQPTPAPQPEVGPTCGTCGLPLWGGPVGNCQFGGNHPAYVAPPEGNIESGTTVEGGGSYDGNGANATPEEEIIPPEPQSVEESVVIEAQ